MPAVSFFQAAHEMEPHQATMTRPSPLHPELQAMMSLKRPRPRQPGGSQKLHSGAVQKHFQSLLATLRPVEAPPVPMRTAAASAVCTARAQMAACATARVCDSVRSHGGSRQGLQQPSRRSRNSWAGERIGAGGLYMS